MAVSAIDNLIRGNFAFLQSGPEEIRRTIPEADQILPEPQTIFLEDESLPPLIGFPILVSRQLGRLNDLLSEYIRLEEDLQIAGHARQTFDSRAYAAGWEAYRVLLAKIVENATVSSHASDFISLFWLYHSLHVSRELLEIPRRVRRKDLAIGRDHGDAIKFKVVAKWLDRCSAMTDEIAKRIATEMREDQESLFPKILNLMRDNLLILTEDHISPDLTELNSYFQGFLRIDGKDFRLRLKSLEEWLRQKLGTDPMLRGVVQHLSESTEPHEVGRLLFRSRFVTFLSQIPGYSTTQHFSPSDLQVWEQLVRRLKEFEILHALRRMIVPIEVEQGQLISRDRSINSTWVGGPPILRLSPATRPIDFSAQWVVNPIVQRFGLIYDITDFSATLSQLGRAEKSALEDAFRMTANFQRQINYLASQLNLRLEKYLGDGAFYSGRHPRKLLIMAVKLQRLYPEFLAMGYPFRSGLRIAMNWGEYRLLPLQAGKDSTRYEFFGHGLVELSRLSTGKKTQELDELRTYLISQGYPEIQVNKFFAPMMRRDSELTSRIDESRRFFAYINHNHTLINEGIVCTEPFIARLGSFEELFYAREQGRGFIVVDVEEEGFAFRVGIRKLGIGKFKGLEPIPVYELVDGSAWNAQDLKQIPSQRLLGALERLFTKTIAASQERQRSPSAAPPPDEY
jgi:hypothetical protein